MFEAFGDNSKGKRLDTSDGLVTVSAIAHHTSEGRHLGQPPSIIFAFKFDRKSHAGTVTSGPAV